MRILKFYFLDRNIISLINDCQHKKPAKSRKHANMLNKLRLIDRPNSRISLISSILEGGSGRHPTKDELYATIQKDSAIIKSFFKIAKTDAEELTKEAEKFSTNFSKEKEEKFNEYCEFLKFALPKICNTASKPQAATIKSDLLSMGDKLNIQRTHIIMICCLAVIYGSTDARKVLKPSLKIGSIYNQISDILTLSRLSMIKAEIEKITSNFTIDFITLDEGLHSLYKKLTVHHQKMDNYTLTATFSLNRSLLPKLNIEEQDELIKELKTPNQEN